MKLEEFRAYIAKLYKLEADSPMAEYAVNIAIPAFGAKKPWSWLRASDTLTSDSSGIITFPDNFEGIISMRQQASTSGGWIYPWPEEKFDFELPRLDNITGSHPLVAKVYQSDGVWYAQLAPAVGSYTVYVTYKKRLDSISDISAGHIRGLKAVVDTLMMTPESVGYINAITAENVVIKEMWREDRKNWAMIWKTMDEEAVQHCEAWWGTWNW